MAEKQQHKNTESLISTICDAFKLEADYMSQEEKAKEWMILMVSGKTKEALELMNDNDMGAIKEAEQAMFRALIKYMRPPKGTFAKELTPYQKILALLDSKKETEIHKVLKINKSSTKDVLNHIVRETLDRVAVLVEKGKNRHARKRMNRYIRQAIDLGADPNITDRKERANALMWSIVVGADDLMDDLLNNTDLNHRNAAKETALVLAISWERNNILNKMVQHKNTSDQTVQDALSYVRWKMQPDAKKILKKALEKRRSVQEKKSQPCEKPKIRTIRRTVPPPPSRK